MQLNNNVHSPNFGMALKITPAAMDALQSSSMKTIDKLAKIGDDLKDTKFYHLEIGEGLAPKIDSCYANSYTAPFSVEKPCDEFLRFNTTWAGTGRDRVGTEFSDFIKFANKEKALEAYNKISESISDVDRAALLTKMLDDREIEKDTIKTAAQVEAAKVKEAAQKLFEQFGAEPHVKP